jgi:DNA recombination protein RmuC
MDSAALLPLVLGLAVGAALGLALGWTAARHRAGSAEAELAAARADLASQRTHAAERLEALRDDQRRLAEQFQALAAEALQRNNAAFIDLAQQRLAQSHQTQSAEFDRRAVEVQTLLTPIKETLGKVEQQIERTDRERAATHSALLEQVRLSRQTTEALQSETHLLMRALRAPQARGAWGELQLARIVELAGMLEHCDFDAQATQAAGDDGVQRPDLVVHLAGGKQIVVDAKVSLSAFLEASASDDPEAARARMQAHARHLRTHVDQLAGKAYWRQFAQSPEFVVMFVPGESFLVYALEHEPGLLEYAMRKQVIVATPTTLLATLRTVAFAWRQDALADNARLVFELGRELYERLGTLGGHLDKLGRSVNGVVKDYNAAVGSLEARVLVSARKLRDLKVADDELPEPARLHESVRVLAHPDLVGDPSGRPAEPDRPTDLTGYPAAASG